MLIHIGYPKAGSDYLQTWFAKHPSFFYKTNSVAGFNNLHEMARYAQTHQKLHDWFVVSSEDLAVWKGDIDIVGLKFNPYDIRGYQNRICLTLHRTFPVAKVLIVTRGFESMLKSFYSQAMLGGAVQSFEEWQRESAGILSVFFDYTFVITLYRQTFGNENVIVLPYELLRDNPAGFLAVIEKSLEIQDTIAFTTEKINPSLTYQLQMAYYRVSKLLYRLVRPFPYPVQKMIYGFYVYQLYLRKPHPFMKLIARLIRQQGEMKVNPATLQSFSGKAEILRHEKLFEPYRKEYLL